jgi:riboflavin synthase
MFTGIVEELGWVHAVGPDDCGARMTIDCHDVVVDARVGDSIAVNGCCVTITALPPEGGFTADLMGESLARTTLGALRPRAPVNLERPLRADGRLGGHLVQGHVDGVAEVLAVEPQGVGGSPHRQGVGGSPHRQGVGGSPHRQGGWTVMRFLLPYALQRYVVEKGSVTLDGVSLTVMSVEPDLQKFSIGLIPHTLAVTTFGVRAVGDLVNVEVDVVAKYVERLLSAGQQTPYKG